MKLGYLKEEKQMKNKQMIIFLSVMILSFGFNGCGGSSSTATGTGGTVSSSTSSNTQAFDAPIVDDTTKQAYLDAINNARAIQQDCGTEGIKPAVSALVWSDELYKAAYEHSEDLAESNTFSHDGSGTTSDWTAEILVLGRGSTTQERIENNGYTSWRAIGENITAGTSRDTAQKAVESWLASDGHCANLMNPAYKDVGMGYVEKSGTTYTHYWTQDFGAK